MSAWIQVNEQRGGPCWETPLPVPIVGDPDLVSDDGVTDEAWKFALELEDDGGVILAYSSPQVFYDEVRRQMRCLVSVLYQARRHDCEDGANP